MSDQHIATACGVTPAVAEAVGLSSAEAKVASALMRCIGRWGLAKTTIPDVAQEAGVSRATVYRLFPGGKSSILLAAMRVEVQGLITLLESDLADSDELETRLVRAMHGSAVFLDEHPALRFMREHEAGEFEKMMSFERMDVVLCSCGVAAVGLLSPFLPPERAYDAGLWSARLLTSYLAEPSDHLDLRDIDDVRFVVRTFMMPGLVDQVVTP